MSVIATRTDHRTTHPPLLPCQVDNGRLWFAEHQIGRAHV